MNTLFNTNFILLLFAMSFNTELIVFDFNLNSNINDWYQTNDDVMGGISNSKMELNSDGHGVFMGEVSTANNGGFAMTRLPVNLKLSNGQNKIVLFVEGDGKDYQLRLKSNINQQYWYIYTFQTTKEMKQIEIPLDEFYPSYRGYKLNKNNFSADTIEEISILIGNKKDEKFKIIIDKIIIN